MPSKHRPLFAPLSLAAGLAIALPALAEPLPADHYSGRWLEVGRTPSKLTDGCVAGSTTYVRKDAEHVDIEDDCAARARFSIRARTT